MPEPTDLMTGAAGEHLVVADLLLSGHKAFLTEQHAPYDVLVDLGHRMVRVQVKSARAPRASKTDMQSPAYVWNVRRAGKTGRRAYGSGEFDVVACVALDIRRIAYVAVGDVAAQHVQVRVPGHEPPELTTYGRRWPVRAGREFDACAFEVAAL